MWVYYNLFVPTEKRGEQMGIKKGTKLTDSPKDRTLKIRFDADTEKKLIYICNKTEKSKAQVIRDGIEKQYQEIKK